MPRIDERCRLSRPRGPFVVMLILRQEVRRPCLLWCWSGEAGNATRTLGTPILDKMAGNFSSFQAFSKDYSGRGLTFFWIWTAFLVDFCLLRVSDVVFEHFWARFFAFRRSFGGVLMNLTNVCDVSRGWAQFTRILKVFLKKLPLARLEVRESSAGEGLSTAPCNTLGLCNEVY